MICRPEPLRLWTIQPWSVWERLEAQGSLRVDPELICQHHCYLWLAPRLGRCLPGYGGGFPWWAYARKPDLRRARHFTARGDRDVRIELEIPAGRAWTFPAWAWDTIFWGEYLTARRPEAEGWDRRMRRAVPDEDEWPLPEPWQSELEASWERLFDPTLPETGWDPRRGSWNGPREAVFEVLDRADVRAITPFVGACPRREPRSADAEGPGPGPAT